jgi:hypothetical protein
MVYEWDEKRARRAQLGKWVATTLVALAMAGLSTATILWFR